MRWISGQKQQVEGGEGCLKSLNGGLEPTGRHPFSGAFKVAVWDVNLQSETVRTKLFFRIKIYCGTSPYFIGPVPWLSHQTNDLLIAGWDGSNPFADSPNRGAKLDLGQNIYRSPHSAPVFSQPNGSFKPSVPSTVFFNSKADSFPQRDSALSSLDTAPSNKPLSWSAERFAQTVKFQPSYTAISPYLCSGNSCEVRLGMYSLPSTDGVVQQVVGKTQQGQAWLAQLAQGQEVYSQKIEQFFPKPSQEAVFEQKLIQAQESVARETDPFLNAPFGGERLIGRVAQVYYGGVGAKIDGNIPILSNGKTLLEESRNFVEVYRARRG